MIFSSIPFVLFFVVFFFFYWFIFSKNLKTQNMLILAGSYFFYAWWDWRFLLLLVFSSWLNFVIGIKLGIANNDKAKKFLLYTGIGFGLALLIYFKYFNFFISSFVDAFSAMGVQLNFHSLKIILPLGISFYTFRTISYLLEIDKRKIVPQKNWVVFFSYVSFFPSLISGPIDKAKLLIPQLEKERKFNAASATDGMQQILWGLFKKIVVADNCAEIANQIFDNYQHLPSSSLLLGALFYTLQLYADFSGYSDMAIGFARLLGFDITRNFNYPFFAQNIAEYWRRWHMSLTTWLTEYVFTPLSVRFRDYGKWGLSLAIIINFTICGIWHGANWTYVLFGVLHGCYFIPIIWSGALNARTKKGKLSMIPSFSEFWKMALTFTIVMFTNIIFRADSISKATEYIGKIFSKSLFSFPLFTNRVSALIALCFSLVMLIAEWLQRDKEHALKLNQVKISVGWRWGIYYLICMVILWFGGNQDSFIYFQF